MLKPIRTIWFNRVLAWRMARREIESRFRGSLLGLLWTVISPLAMLAVYSLVFGSIFGSRWSRPEAVPQVHDFAYPMLLFLGLTVFAVMSDPINRAPSLILENASYVKKVLFPLELLPVIVIINALVTSFITFLVFLAVYVFLYGVPPTTFLFLPLILIPVVFFALGFTFFISSLGVFLRDIRHVVPLATTAMLFLSSVFYSPDAIPDPYRWMLYANPLTFGVEHARDVVFWGRFPETLQWLGYFAASLVFLMGSMLWFERTKKAFADVL